MIIWAPTFLSVIVAVVGAVRRSPWCFVGSALLVAPFAHYLSAAFAFRGFGLLLFVPLAVGTAVIPPMPRSGLVAAGVFSLLVLAFGVFLLRMVAP